MVGFITIEASTERRGRASLSSMSPGPRGPSSVPEMTIDPDSSRARSLRAGIDSSKPRRGVTSSSECTGVDFLLRDIPSYCPLPNRRGTIGFRPSGIVSSPTFLTSPDESSRGSSFSESLPSSLDLSARDALLLSRKLFSNFLTGPWSL